MDSQTILRELVSQSAGFASWIGMLVGLACLAPLAIGLGRAVLASKRYDRAGRY